MSALTPIDPGGWAPYLEPGEAMLWEGGPVQGLRFGLSDLGPSFVGLIFCIFSVAWVVTAAGGEGPAFLPYLGKIPLLIGLYLLIGRLLYRAYRLARTRYALTDRRAIVATTYLGRRMRSFPLSDGPEEVRLGEVSDIVFARETDLGQRIRPRAGDRPNVNDVGFLAIAEGRRVAELIAEAKARL